MDGVGPAPAPYPLGAALKLSIVIIHYNTSEDLGRCLTSLSHCPPSCDYEVSVIDNASQDIGLAAVRERFDTVTWVMNEENAGYARGVNQGLAGQESEFTLVLNPDIVIQPGSLDALLACADTNPRAGIIAPQLLNEDGSIQDSCRRFYTLRTLLMKRTFLGKIFNGAVDIDHHLMHDFDHMSLRAVDWVIGGAMLIRHEAVVAVGPMDERFFLYFEDVDWCYRMGQSGWDVLYTPEARFIHRHRRESAKGLTHRSFWLHLGSMISFYEKWGMFVWLLKRWRDPVNSVLLWCVDVAALNVAFAGAWGARALLNPYFTEALFPLSEYRPLQLFATLLMTVAHVFQGRYRTSASRHATSLMARLQQTGILAMLLLTSTWLSHQTVYSRAVLLFFFPLLLLTSEVGERWLRLWRGRMERGWLSLERTLLVGTLGDVSSWLSDRSDPREDGLDVVGWLHTRDGEAPTNPVADHVPCLGAEGDLTAVVQRHRIAQVVFWSWPKGDLRELRELARLREERIRLRWCVPEAVLLNAGARPARNEGPASVVLDPGSSHPASAAVRRGLDVLVGLLSAPLTMIMYGISMLVPGWTRLRLDVDSHRHVRDPWSLTVVCDGQERPRSLIWQAGFIGALIRGRMTLLGPPLVRVSGSGDRSVEDAWSLDIPRPGLMLLKQDPGMSRADFYHDPAGVAAALAAAGQEEVF